MEHFSNKIYRPEVIYSGFQLKSLVLLDLIDYVKPIKSSRPGNNFILIGSCRQFYKELKLC